MTQQNTATQTTTPAIVDMEDTNSLKAELERLKKENETLKANKRQAGPFSMKVSEKGGVSVYGLGRFPVTLYGEQWDKLIERIEEVKAFIADARSKKLLKEDPEAVAASKKAAAERTNEALKKLPKKS